MMSDIERTSEYFSVEKKQVKREAVSKGYRKPKVESNSPYITNPQEENKESPNLNQLSMVMTSNDNQLEISESFIENDDKNQRKSPEFIQPVASKFEPRESIFGEEKQ